MVVLVFFFFGIFEFESSKIDGFFFLFVSNINSKVSISMELHRSQATRYSDEYEEAEEPEEYDPDEQQPETVYDKTTRTRRAVASGHIITKHNPEVCGARNREKMDHFPLSFAR